MKLMELVSLNDVLKGSHYMKLLRHLSATKDINTTRIKNQIIQSWKSGLKSRKHYDDLLKSIDISLNDLIDK